MATKKQDEQPQDEHIGEDGRPQPHAEETEQGAAPGPLNGPTPPAETIETVPVVAVYAAKEIAPPEDPRAETPQNQTQPKQLPVSDEDTTGYDEATDVKHQ